MLRGFVNIIYGNIILLVLIYIICTRTIEYALEKFVLKKSRRKWKKLSCVKLYSLDEIRGNI